MTYVIGCSCPNASRGELRVDDTGSFKPYLRANVTPEEGRREKDKGKGISSSFISLSPFPFHLLSLISSLSLFLPTPSHWLSHSFLSLSSSPLPPIGSHIPSSLLPEHGLMLETSFCARHVFSSQSPTDIGVVMMFHPPPTKVGVKVTRNISCLLRCGEGEKEERKERYEEKEEGEEEEKGERRRGRGEEEGRGEGGGEKRREEEKEEEEEEKGERRGRRGRRRGGEKQRGRKM